ncbi:7014_t:CDS:2 [Entrophospora sp. SA101]|nr:7014_t:CDS:2 [Entrophospora sp. SA101]
MAELQDVHLMTRFLFDTLVKRMEQTKDAHTVCGENVGENEIDHGSSGLGNNK